MDSFNGKNACSRLDATLTGLIEIFRPICLSNLRKPQNEQNFLYEKFLNTLMKGIEFLKKWENTSCFNFLHSLRYGFQIRQLEKEISDFLHYQMPVHIFLEVKSLISELNNLRQLYELGSMDESTMNETIFKNVSKLTNDPQQNAVMLLQQMGADDMLDGSFVKCPCNYDEPGKSDFVVGLEKNIWNVKRTLLHSEVSIVGVQGMGGLGKTTLALALSDDKEIKASSKPRSKMYLQVLKLKVAYL